MRISYLPVFICSTFVLLVTLEVETCMKQKDLSEFWDWLFPPEFDISEKLIENQEKLFELSGGYNREVLLHNGLEDFEYGDELHKSRQRRNPIDHDAGVIDGFDDADNFEPQERYGRMILNKTDDNKTATIKELNPGYFELKFKFEHPELNAGGNDTAGNGTAGGGAGTPAPAAAPAA